MSVWHRSILSKQLAVEAPMHSLVFVQSSDHLEAWKRASRSKNLRKVDVFSKDRVALCPCSICNAALLDEHVALFVPNPSEKVEATMQTLVSTQPTEQVEA